MKTALQGRRQRLGFCLKAGFLLLFFGGLFLFFNFKKEALAGRCQEVVRSLFKRQTDLEVSFEKVRVHIFGAVTLERIKVTAPWLPEEDRILFQAESICVRYRLLDFLSKRFDSKILVTVTRPSLVWAPRLKLRNEPLPFFGWMREWVFSGFQNMQLDIKDLSVRFGGQTKSIRGIQVSLSRELFHVEAPLTHTNLGSYDVTSTIHIRGWYEAGSQSRSDAIRGELTTEGTIVNWKPVETEARFDLLLNPDEIRLTTADLLGGFQILARVDFLKDYSLTASIKAEDYPFSNLAPFTGGSQKFQMPQKLDLEAEFTGALLEPQVNVRSRIHEGWIGKTAFKALDINGSGVYPTVTLSDSKILMADGVTTMRFADRPVEIKELFKNEVFQKLISEAEQDRIVWGNWEMSRPKDDNDLSEFMMQRLLGENARVHFRKYNEDPERPVSMAEVESTPLEFGFEYKLMSENALKVEVRDGEEFVGVERKVTF